MPLLRTSSMHGMDEEEDLHIESTSVGENSLDQPADDKAQRHQNARGSCAFCKVPGGGTLRYDFCRRT